MLVISNISVDSNRDYLDINMTMDRGMNNGYIMAGRVLQDIPNLFTHIVFTVFSTKNASSLILFNTTVNFCVFMADTSRNLFLKSFYGIQEDGAQYPQRCPIRKVLLLFLLKLRFLFF